MPHITDPTDELIEIYQQRTLLYAQLSKLNAREHAALCRLRPETTTHSIKITEKRKLMLEWINTWPQIDWRREILDNDHDPKLRMNKNQYLLIDECRAVCGYSDNTISSDIYLWLIKTYKKQNLPAHA